MTCHVYGCCLYKRRCFDMHFCRHGHGVALLRLCSFNMFREGRKHRSICKQSGDSMCVMVMSALHLHGLLALPKQHPSVLLKNIYLGRKMLEKSLEDKQSSTTTTTKRRLRQKTDVSAVWKQVMERDDPSEDKKKTGINFHGEGKVKNEDDELKSSKPKKRAKTGPEPSPASTTTTKTGKTGTTTNSSSWQTPQTPQTPQAPRSCKDSETEVAPSSSPIPPSRLRETLARAKKLRMENARKMK